MPVRDYVLLGVSPILLTTGGGGNDDPTGNTTFFPFFGQIITICVCCRTAVGTTPTLTVNNTGFVVDAWMTVVERGDAEGAAGYVAIVRGRVTTAGSGTVTVTVNNTGSSQVSTTQGVAYFDLWYGGKADQTGAAVGEGTQLVTNNSTPNVLTTTAQYSRVIGCATDMAALGTMVSTDLYRSIGAAAVPVMAVDTIQVHKVDDTINPSVVTLNFDCGGAGAPTLNWVAMELLSDGSGTKPKRLRQVNGRLLRTGSGRLLKVA